MKGKIDRKNIAAKSLEMACAEKEGKLFSGLATALIIALYCILVMIMYG